jgi:hypothetical protein
MIGIRSSVDQMAQFSTILFRTYHFDEIAIHESSRHPFIYRRPAHESKEPAVRVFDRLQKSTTECRTYALQMVPAVP